ncbi:MAG: ABC transporter substrate-binding protein [Actinomycetota bacterium]
MKRTISAGLLLLAACTSNPARAAGATIFISAPFARAPALSEQILNGARVAIDQINRAGGVPGVGRLGVRTYDNGLSPEHSVAMAREAVRAHAAAIVDEGSGVDASWRIAAAAGIPIGIVAQGAMSLVDPVSRPNVFRIMPTDRGVAFRLAEYLIPKGLRIALLYDDTTYGAGGIVALDKAFARNPSSVAARIRIPSSSQSAAAQVLQARDSGATAVLVWARPPTVAQVISAARSTGWGVPLYAAPSGEDPIVRRQLSDHASWLDGFTVAIARLTAEKGSGPWQAFERAYERAFGVQRVGVRSGGEDVIQLPDQAMYAYDFVKVVAAAMARAHSATGSGDLVRAMNAVEVQGANGDERAFNEKNHEGVVDDDIFFAVFHDMVWAPVKDDALSATLPSLKQTR